MEIESYGDKGSLSSERIGFRVISDCDLSFYVVYSSHLLENGGFYNKPINTYWFTPKNLKAGDKVVLYTKSGINSEKKESGSSTVYFFYWGLSKPIFNKKSSGVVLSEMNSWETSWK